MFELLVIILFCWLAFQSVGLALTLTWGFAKILVSILFAVAIPVFLICLFVGGIVLLLPLALIGAALGILKACL